MARKTMVCRAPALALACAGVWMLAGGDARAQPDSAAAGPLIGMTAPLSGANASYGQGLLHGVRLGLSQSAPTAVLRVLDDQGSPQLAAAHARTLIEGGAVALTGVHGALSAEALRPVLTRAQVPLVGVASSAEVLRNPAQREVFNLRAGAGDEVEAIVLHLDTLGLDRIAALAQDDALGSSGLDGLKTELTRLAMRPVALETVAVAADAAALGAALKRLCGQAPQALLLALPADRALVVMRDAVGHGCSPRLQYVAFSETGAALADQGAQAAGLAVSQVLPHPHQRAHPLASAYLQALGPAQRASYPSLEGYLYGRVLGEVLRSCGRRVSPACIVDTLESRPPEVAGWRLRFSRTERRGARFVDITLIGSAGRIVR